MNITGKGAYETGTYVNLFHKSGYNEEEINARLEQTWNDLFMEMNIHESTILLAKTKLICWTRVTTMFVPKVCPMA